MGVDHKIGSSLVIDANILGGLHFEGKRGDNAKNGRDVSLLAKKGNDQMWKITWSTEKINNANEFRFILHDTFDVNPESILDKNIISKYKILTPFNSRTGEFEFYVNKKDKNVLLNKFYAKGKVMKDGLPPDYQLAMDLTMMPYISLANYMIKATMGAADLNDDSMISMKEILDFSDAGMDVKPHDVAGPFWYMGGHVDFYGEAPILEEEKVSKSRRAIANWLVTFQGVMRDPAFSGGSHQHCLV